MTTEVVIQLVTSFGIIPALFVWLLMYIMAENKKDKDESRKREIVLMEHIGKSDIILSEIMRSIEHINSNVSIVQTDVAILKER